MQKLPQPLKLSKYDSNAAKTNLELILHECRVKQCFFLNLGYIYSIISLKCGITSSFLYSNKNKLPLLQSTNTLTTYAVSDTQGDTHPPTNRCSCTLSALSCWKFCTKPLCKELLTFRQELRD